MALTTKSSRGKGMTNAEQQARSQLASIIEMTEAVRNASTESERDGALTRIYEDPLSVEVRGAWHVPGEQGVNAAEFAVLLCTGGPAVRIRGDLHRGEPDSAWVEYQDWFTPWEALHDVAEAERAALLDYCRQLYFAE